MGFLSNLKGVLNKMLGRQEITQPFGIQSNISDPMTSYLKLWDELYMNSSAGIPSIIASEAARLATSDMEIKVIGGARADIINNIVNSNRDRFRTKLEFGCVYGGLILKPNGLGIDFIPSTKFVPVKFDDNGNIIAVIFVDTFIKNKTYYNRLEYHHIEGSNYIIENKAFSSESPNKLGFEIKLSVVSDWSHIEPYVELTGVDRPLFGYFRMPNANFIDVNSPLGVSIFARSVETCRDFDLIYSKWKREVKLSDKLLFINDDALMQHNPNNNNKLMRANPLPELIYGLQFKPENTKEVEEWSPSIRVEEYRNAMQTQLDLISVQCGFSSGYFSFDSKTGAITATQVESEDQRTFSTCTDIQANYKQAIEGFMYAINVMISLYTDLPEETLEFSYYMKDLFVSFDDDRNRAYQLAQNKYIPKWKYLVDYEGYGEEEAKAMVAEAESINKTEPVSQ